MPRKRLLISVAPMAELMKRAGAERVSDEAALALSETLMDIGMEIAKDAIKFAHHAGRKTIKRSDIELAKKNI